MNKAQLYAKYNGLQKHDAGLVLDDYLRLIKFNPEGGDCILDVGCGSGDVTTTVLMPKLPKNFKRLTGSDVCEEMVEFATKYYEYPKVNFIQLDIESREIPVDLEGEYDHIFSFYCLHWIQNQQQALKNIYDLLKPGGDTLLTFLASNPIYTIYERLAVKEKWTTYMKNYKNFISPYHKTENPESVFEKLLHDVGLSSHLCKVIDREYTYTDIKVLKQSIIAVSPFKIPEELHNDYLDDYLEEVRSLGLFNDDDGSNNAASVSIRVPYKLFVVVASKKKQEESPRK